MCVKLNSLFDSEIKVYYVTQVLKQGISTKAMCRNFILEFRNEITLIVSLSRRVGQDRKCHC